MTWRLFLQLYKKKLKCRTLPSAAIRSLRCTANKVIIILSIRIFDSRGFVFVEIFLSCEKPFKSQTWPVGKHYCTKSFGFCAWWNFSHWTEKAPTLGQVSSSMYYTSLISYRNRDANIPWIFDVLGLRLASIKLLPERRLRSRVVLF